ncbi:hypothetical protein [Chishuiella sp.]|uniref:hypothetical protein n=1 Tax=Chishuiella sp. TaxID=1969467 RepID=UPI0028AD9414|nr:hypothetical protein [Chishuiella sp.]
MKTIHFYIFVLFSFIVKAQVGINTQNPQGLFNVDGKTSTATTNATTGTPTDAQLADDFIIMKDGSVGVGAIPVSSAIMELNVSQLASGSKKGFLGPRIALKSYNDNTTISSPATGLLVYNLGTESTFTYAGYVFWDGTQWKTLDGKTLNTGSVNSITCSAVKLSPINYTLGTEFNGTLTVPYTDGNGGIYPAQTIGPLNGLTATLTAGNFNLGTGELIYSVSGTTTVSSPTTTTFPISIGGQTCNAVVGGARTLEPGEFQFFNYEIPASYVGLLSANSSGGSILMGKIRIDIYFNASSNTTGAVYPNIPRIYNATTSNIKLWYSAVSNVTNYMGGNILLAPGGYVNTDDGIYLNLGYNDISTSAARTAVTGTIPAQETETIDFVVDGVWYRMTIFIIVDNKNTATDTDNTRIINIVAQRMSGYN